MKWAVIVHACFDISGFFLHVLKVVYVHMSTHGLDFHVSILIVLLCMEYGTVTSEGCIAA